MAGDRRGRHNQSRQLSTRIPRFDDRGDPVEQAVEALRVEWRSGFTGNQVRHIAIPAVRSLASLAATGQAQEEVGQVLYRLDRYATLDTEQRKTELAELASLLNALKPHLRLASDNGEEFGKLNSAVAPGRARARVEPPAIQTPAQDAPARRVAPLKMDAPVTALTSVAEKTAKLLDKLNIRTVGDLVKFAPRRHIDYTRTIRIGEAIGLRSGEEITVRGRLLSVEQIRGPKTTRVEAKLDDGTGWIRIVWFNNYLGRQLGAGDEIAVSGPIQAGYGRPSLDNPEWEWAGRPGLTTGRLTPVYSLTQGLTQKSMRRLTRAALDATKTTLVDALPHAVVDPRGLMRIDEAYESLHYPANQQRLERAKTRLTFEEMLLLQLGLIQRRSERQSAGGFSFTVDPALIEEFEAGLPFRFTRAQRKVIQEIAGDLRQNRPMARLLQGDVGSGKTAVAATAALIAYRNGFQSAVLAPTEILAEQHLHNFQRLFAGVPEDARPQVGLLTGSTRAKERREILGAVIEGDINVLVGTHAIIQDTVTFKNLGLSIVDEQHRFGVRQRQDLPDKAREIEPHVLSMTATPIPRTLNAVIHGDLDVSIIDQLPPGRIPIETRAYIGAGRDNAYQLIRQEVAKGRQVFVICPLVEESDLIEAKAAVAESERLQNDVFPELRVQVLHGRMSGKEKEAIMKGFRDRAWDILVSTSVIEVGIDIPNATVMVIEGADRFGLSQLHQFRGRVGRGGEQSYCLLLADDASINGEKRMQLMVDTNDGFLLAEKDLELRGPGDFFGTRQSGLPETTWLTSSFDTRLLDEARETAERLLASDPGLRAEQHRKLRYEVERFWAGKGGFSAA